MPKRFGTKNVSQRSETCTGSEDTLLIEEASMRISYLLSTTRSDDGRVVKLASVSTAAVTVGIFGSHEN